MKYDIAYYIKKFSAIPEDRWNDREFKIPSDATPVPGTKYTYCALGHCGASMLGYPEEADVLFNLALNHGFNISKVNDGKDPRFPQANPKLRVLAALSEAKKGEKV